MRICFPPGVTDAIGWYVYRLIDPRNGETFYVGKGRGDRVFSHALGALDNSRRSDDEEDAFDLKLARVRDIIAGGFEVVHLIHQHSIPSEKIAYRIETAVIDAYPGLTNRVSGHGASEYGVRHVEEIIAEFQAEVFKPKHRILAINIRKSYLERSIYDAVRGVWKIKLKNAEAQEIVLAVVGRIVRGVFAPQTWLEATPQNFPQLPDTVPARYGFVGVEAEQEVKLWYLNKLVPEKYQHGQNPIRFIPPEN